MRKTIFLSIIGLIILSSCSKDETIFGSGTLVTETRDVNSFTKIKSEGVFEVTITKGEIQSVQVTADNNVISRVRTTVKNNELTLSLTDDNFGSINLKANITVPRLNGIKNFGVGNIVAQNFEEPGAFNVLNSGSGIVRVTGSANELDVYNEGSGDFYGFGLQVQDAFVKNVGSGKVEVSCSGRLDVSIDGSGDVYYKGEPAINVSVSGSGSLIKMD